MAEPAAPPRAGALRRLRPSGALAGVVPFFAYTTVFLIVPTAVVVIGAFLDADNRFTLGNLEALTEPSVVRGLTQSVILSAVTSLVGALVGGVLAYAVSTAREGSVTRRFFTSLCGVLAQFGGVALAFAFIASFSAQGLLSVLLGRVGLGTGSGLWLYEWDRGLVLVYLYFQIPLMLIVFLPAVEGLRPQWREATETLGGTTWTYWRRVAGPILMPSFVGAALLLFTNAFSAYSTAKALVSQANPLLPLQIGSSLSSEVILGQENAGKAMALEMVLVVAVVMVLYAWLDRRAGRWMR
ncbi:ABC transporter permease [Phycicoccus endophyticus]|uniref:ABC transporter permease n=1 Tax=Phycicoccus endophyticus TaxID=1690220 RepID=UPI0019B22C8F|nr:ABC transporter permease subunit [Phycicoccus endophyticus]GGL29323.1 ABC transporter permease [Phycicoccus endophyticus]